MPGRIEGAPELVGGWVDGYKIVGSLTLSAVTVVAILFLLLLAFAWNRRRNRVYGHKVDWQ